MVIRSYSKFISESRNGSKGRNLGIGHYREEMAMLENEYLRMQSEGLTESEINENIFTSFLSRPVYNIIFESICKTSS